MGESKESGSRAGCHHLRILALSLGIELPVKTWNHILFENRGELNSHTVMGQETSAWCSFQRAIVGMQL